MCYIVKLYMSLELNDKSIKECFVSNVDPSLLYDSHALYPSLYLDQYQAKTSWFQDF
jgi:hypothetical protein